MILEFHPCKRWFFKQLCHFLAMLSQALKKGHTILCHGDDAFGLFILLVSKGGEAFAPIGLQISPDFFVVLIVFQS